MEKAKLVKADSKAEEKTFDVSSMSMDDILKLQAELNTKKSEIEKAMTAKFETVFSQVTDLLLGQGISLTAKQIEGARSILSPTSGALNAGALVSFSQAFVSAGMGNIQEYFTVERDGKKTEYMIRLRPKVEKKKTKEKKEAEKK